ncbi:Heat induced stress protein YflT [Alkalibacterium subtropicum]|uniref:Heat induced stress protein YflT n=1 Tax=Alkalibacterium subtropicum TaxID=753702 RepID=A0A1I1JWJ1_9LACT|nr:general stress protein [Alkalibacterium subtropicum]SFC52621.1 Heat induced stress protein YflT [Alkalibacterium subtropicum]
MQEKNKTVVGSYDTRDEALNIVHKLKDAGYQKENIILYANENVTQTQSDYEAVNVEADTTPTRETRETNKDDQSLWEQIKDAFSSDTYDHDERRRDASYNQEDDLLYPYRDDIKSGKVVVVLDGYKGEDLNQYNSAAAVHDTDGGTPRTTPVNRAEDDRATHSVDRDHDKLGKTDRNTSDKTDTANGKADLDNYKGVRDTDPDTKVNPSGGKRDLTKQDDNTSGDINDPLTGGRDFSREDEDMDAYKK